MARPKKESGTLNCPVSFRLSAEDFRAFQAKVELSGMNPSEYFRECILTNKTVVVGKATPSNRQREVLYLVNLTTHRIASLVENVTNTQDRPGIDGNDFKIMLEELHAIQEFLKIGVRHVD